MIENNINENSISSGMRALPVFKGYTVDFRLRQFRRANPEAGIQFIDFASAEGDDMLEEYLGTLDGKSPEFKEIAAYLTKGWLPIISLLLCQHPWLCVSRGIS